MGLVYLLTSPSTPAPFDNDDDVFLEITRNSVSGLATTPCMKEVENDQRLSMGQILRSTH